MRVVYVRLLSVPEIYNLTYAFKTIHNIAVRFSGILELNFKGMEMTIT